ncbi:MAG TPA: sigma-70 family RNA polymerase sigma factor [Polyangiaceae bacterium]|nr:sigma-70 family RNA polymerase sigma factor [Polyangiaceae bacterium]
MRSSSELSNAEPGGSGDGPLATAPSHDPARNFSALVRSEFEWVWRLLRRVGLSPADADDATQQVFLVAARRQGEVESGRARAFLYGITLRIASNARRTLRRRREVPSEAADRVAAGGPSLDELVEQRRARELLDELLARLPVELRRVLVLAEVEQLTASQIAELEVLPVGTVASRLRRARAAFYAMLEQEQHRNPFDRRPP